MGNSGVATGGGAAAPTAAEATRVVASLRLLAATPLVGVAILLGGGQGRLRHGPSLAVLKAATPTGKVGGRRRASPVAGEAVATPLTIVRPPGLPLAARPAQEGVDTNTEGPTAAPKASQDETVAGEAAQAGAVLLEPATGPRRKSVVEPETFPTRMTAGASCARGRVKVVATTAGLAATRVAGLTA